MAATGRPGRRLPLPMRLVALVSPLVAVTVGLSALVAAPYWSVADDLRDADRELGQVVDGLAYGRLLAETGKHAAEYVYLRPSDRTAVRGEVEDVGALAAEVEARLGRAVAAEPEHAEEVREAQRLFGQAQEAAHEVLRLADASRSEQARRVLAERLLPLAERADALLHELVRADEHQLSEGLAELTGRTRGFAVLPGPDLSGLLTQVRESTDRALGAATLQHLVVEEVAGLPRSLALGTRQERERGERAAVRTADELTQLREVLVHSRQSGTGRALDAFADAHTVLARTGGEVLAAAERGQLDRAVARLEQDLQPVLDDEALPALRQLLDSARAEVALARADVDDAVTSMGATLAAAAGLLALLLIAMATVVSRRIVGPVLGLEAAAAAVRDGDLSVRVPQGRDDELGDLAAGFNAMVGDLQAGRQELTRQAFSDALTGLANRALLSDRAAQALSRARRDTATVAVVVLDLDGFKDVNDTLGHAAGDEVITTAAARLRAVVRDGDTVARLGGDEFVLLLEDLGHPHEAFEVAVRALAQLAGPMTVLGREIRLTASAGVACPAALRAGGSRADDARAVDDLLRDADVAMYQAKARGKSQAVVFEDSMREVVQDRLDLLVDIRAAAARGQIAVLYQPLVDVERGDVVGFEALARWQHPERGTVSPAVFIPLAEETGAIGDIGRTVLREACGQAAQWARLAGEGGRPMEMSVNLSGRQLTSGTVVDDVRVALAESGLPASQLVLEITETALLEDLVAAEAQLRQLKALGVRIAMDDFGTGYSSLSYLRRLPIDILKIDKSFLDDRAGRGRELLSGVAALGATLGLLTVAEGIEGQEQLDQVRSSGCDYGQGYHFARPMPAKEATALLGRGRVPAAAVAVR